MAVQIEGKEGVAFRHRRKCDEHFHCGIYVAVGDDYEWHVDYHDVRPLDDHAYCPNCGQTGCDWRG